MCNDSDVFKCCTMHWKCTTRLPCPCTKTLKYPKLPIWDFFNICEPGQVWNYGSCWNQVHNLGKTWTDTQAPQIAFRWILQGCIFCNPFLLPPHFIQYLFKCEEFHNYPHSYLTSSVSKNKIIILYLFSIPLPFPRIESILYIPYTKVYI